MLKSVSGDHYAIDIVKEDGYDVILKESENCKWLNFFSRPVVKNFSTQREAKEFVSLYAEYVKMIFRVLTLCIYVGATLKRSRDSDVYHYPMLLGSLMGSVVEAPFLLQIS